MRNEWKELKWWIVKNDINPKSNWIETQQKQHTIYISMWICAYASELEVDIWAWRNTKKSLVCFVKVEFKKKKLSKKIQVWTLRTETNSEQKINFSCAFHWVARVDLWLIHLCNCIQRSWHRHEPNKWVFFYRFIDWKILQSICHIE